jgi:hypothetical protein
MNPIPHKDRVAVHIRFNGYIHKAYALQEEQGENNQISIFFDQPPKGFHAEHGS